MCCAARSAKIPSLMLALLASAAVPGTRMGNAGVKDPQERAGLIAFLDAAGPCDN